MRTFRTNKNGKRLLDPNLEAYVINTTLAELNALDRRIYFICRELGITQSAIAKLCGTTWQTIWHWQKGVSIPNAVFYSYILKLEELAKQKYEERQNQK